ncbi:MAG: rod-binding protein [bacterium]
MEPLAIQKSNFLPRSRTENTKAAEQPTRLKEVAQTFESLFVLQLLQEMEKTLETGSIFGAGIEGKTYGELIEWELARRISAQSPLGIADALIRQLEPLSTASLETGETNP